MDRLWRKTNCVLLFYFSVFVLAFLLNLSVVESKCSAVDNVKWNNNKNKCVPCSDCPPGHFRNLTKEYTGRKGPKGDEQCLRCTACADGTYSENGRGECIKCRMNCTELNREYDYFCSRIQDAKCGSCFSGFTDTYGHTLFSCSKRELRLLPDPEDISQHPTNDNDISSRVPAEIVIAICGGVSLFILLLSVLMKFVYVRTRNNARQNHGSNQQVSYSRVQVNDVSRDNDIETDAAHAEDTIPKVSQHEYEVVRSELATTHQPNARPEITHPISTIQYDGIVYIQLSDRSEPVRFNKKEDICKCRSVNRCQCQTYVFPDHEMERSDEYITVVASKVCHDPFPLFHKLGLEDPIIYQEDNTRDRDPVNISQKELVINLLNRWIEVQSTPTTLQQLSKALCEADFHNINDTLYDKHKRKNRTLY